MKKHFLMMLLICQLATVSKIYAQNIAINGTGSLPDTSAMLDVSSVNKGFLAPRMTTLQQNAIPLPAKGLLIYNTTDNGFRVNTGTPASPSWITLALGSGTITHALSYTNNVLTNTINGVGSSINIINAVGNSSANNVLSTTVNGMVGSGVPIINSNALSISGTNLTSTVNGVASTGLNLSSLVAASTTNALTSSTNMMTSTTNGVSATAPMVNSNALSLSGTNLTSTVNGVASAALNLATILPNDWGILGNSNIGAGNFLGTTNSNNLRFRTNNIERMVIDATGNTGIGITDPGAQLVVKDNFEIRRTGTVAQMIFTNTGGSGDFRLGGDGGDIYWQGGGGRSLQMGSYWPTILIGDRQTATFPAFANGVTGTSIIIASARDASVPLGVQANSASQTANLTEWRNSGGTVLSVIDELGNIGAGTANPGSKLDVKGTLRLSGSTSGYVGFAPAAAAGSTTYTLPSADGTNGQQLTTNGTGTLSWAAAATTTNAASLSGNNLTTTVNGIASAALDLSPVVTANSWSKTGNAGTTPGTNFIGTTDNQDLVIKVNNTEGMRITSAGNVAINTTTANSTLEVNGSVAVKLITSSGTGALTLNSAGTVYYVNSAVSTIVLPAATTCTNRVYTIVNRSGANRTISSFTNLSGAATTSIPSNSSMDVISNGSSWLQIK